MAVVACHGGIVARMYEAVKWAWGWVRGSVGKGVVEEDIDLTACNVLPTGGDVSYN